MFLLPCREMLADSSGMAIGTMNADSFIENAGDEINAYEKVNLKLYYANEDGTGLVEENRRNVVYNSNISLEKLVVEQLVKGAAHGRSLSHDQSVYEDHKCVG